MQIEYTEFQDKLVRGLAHKMNNILSLFHGYIDLLADHKHLDPKMAEGLKRLKEGAVSATELINRTAIFSTPAATVLRELDIIDFLNVTRPAFETCLERGIQLEIHCEEEVPRVLVDASRFKTVIMELVRNAAEASPTNGKVRLVIRTILVESQVSSGGKSLMQPLRWVSIAVEDKGKGITEEIFPKIFEPFYTTQQKRNAVGLGLTVALGLIQHMNGTIRVESSEKGTTMYLMLPPKTEGLHSLKIPDEVANIKLVAS